MFQLAGSPLDHIFNHYRRSSFNVIRKASNSASLPGLKLTCLHELHRSKGARLEPFAGYEMPIVYKGHTIKSEHVHTRKSASLFDVSHMMQVVVKGKDRENFLEGLTVADIKSLPIGRCTLSVFCNDSGGIIDDCIVAKKEDHLHIVSNAANASKVLEWLRQHRTKYDDCIIEREDNKGLVAFQGPAAAEILHKQLNFDSKDLMFMNTTDVNLKGVGCCQITRCGYTGEDGFEISVTAESAIALVEALSVDDRVQLAGLGARDTLRLEAGLCLHGNDISEQTTPVEAGLNWTVHKRRRTEAGFIGSEVILRQLREGCAVKRTGLVASAPGGPPARKGTRIVDTGSSQDIGEVTSGTFGPSVECNIAMAYLPSEMANRWDTKVACMIRGKTFEYKLARMPFVRSNYYTKSSK